MASFPEFAPSETDKAALNNQWGKQWIDAIIQYGNSSDQQERLRKIQRNYNNYNGVYSAKAKKYLVSTYGSDLSTAFTPFHLAQTKLNLLFGELLDIGLKSTVESVNPEAVNEKLQQIAIIAEAMNCKQVLQGVQDATGMKPLNGIPIPDPGSPQAEIAMKPKRKNEVIMQRIADKKIQEDYIQMKLQENFKHLVLTNECHGKVERDQNGVDTYRPIDPKYMIFQESPSDPLCLRTPFVGERRLLYKHEILAMFPDLSIKDKDIIKHMGTSEQDTAVDTSQFQNIDGQIAIMCYYCQWKTSRPNILKTQPSKKQSEPYKRFLDPMQYEQYRSSFDRDAAKGDFSIDIKYQDDIWEGWRIGNNMYSSIHRKENQIQRLINGKFRAQFDYIHCLYGTIDGKRISLQEIIFNLSEVYDLVMFIIKREIKKVKGKVYTYDEKYMPQSVKGMAGVMYDVVEHGVIRFNSSDEDHDPDQVADVAKFISSIDLGLSQSFEILLNLKSNIELTVNKLTGINEEREGYAKASQTATGTMQNVNASRSITRDLFYMIQVFSSLMLTRLVDLVKLNKEYLNSIANLFASSEDLGFLKITEGITMDEFAAYFTDGRKYNEIKEFAMQFFGQEINAGNLRAQDAVRFKASESLAEGLNILEKAWKIMDGVRTQEMQAKSEQMQQEQEFQHKENVEDREDWQAHEVEIESMKLKGKAGSEMLNAGVKGTMQTQQLQHEKEMTTQEQNPDNPPDQLT